MRLSCPVSFTHVYLLIWWWLCEDKGGFQRRYKQTDRKVRRPGPGCQCSGWVTVLFPAICFPGGGPAVLCWMHRHERVRSSPPRHSIGIAAFHINMAVCVGLPCLFVGAKLVRFRLRTDKKSSLTLRLPICLSSVCFSCLWHTLNSKKKHWHSHNLLHIAEL